MYTTFLFYKIPVKIGAILLKTIVGPRLKYWPKTISIKKRGNPTSTNMIAYGIRNTAEK